MLRELAGVVGVSCLLIGAPLSLAAAADLPLKAPPPPAWSWTGCYAGGTFGGDWVRDSGFSAPAGSTTAVLGAPGTAPTFGPTTPGPITGPFTGSGVVYGADVGCNYQFGHWVVGAEGDFQVFGNNPMSGQFLPGTAPFLSAVTFTTAGGAAATYTLNNFMSINERWLATARARVGYAFDRTLVYATGGAAWADIDASFFCNGSSLGGPPLNPGNCHADQFNQRLGWTAGAGLEYAWASRLTVRAEYLFVWIPSYTTLTNGNFGGTPGSGIPLGVNTGNITTQIVRIGVNFKLY